jgi:hypothetical protein
VLNPNCVHSRKVARLCSGQPAEHQAETTELADRTTGGESGFLDWRQAVKRISKLKARKKRRPSSKQPRLDFAIVIGDAVLWSFAIGILLEL